MQSEEHPQTRESVPPFTALGLQMDCTAVNGLSRAEAQAQMLKVIAKLKSTLAVTSGFTRSFAGTETKLIVLPEYFLSSFPMGESIPKWREIAAIAQDGPEYEALGAIAQAQKCYLAGNVYEQDPKFPELYFQVCFIIAPNGNVALRYRRLISLFAPSPADVWDKFLHIYGIDAVFPVLRTEIGNLACVASEEILYPEIARNMVLRGAEILCHSTSEVGAPGLTPKEISRRARAVENMVFVVCANTARIVGTPMPIDSTGGMSKVIDYKGQVLAEAYPGETACANAVLHIDALRSTRRLSGMTNMLSRQPLEVYMAGYAGHSVSPLNTFLDGDIVCVPDRAFFIQRQAAAIKRLAQTGVI